jgi:hypothetical protein
MEKCWSRPRRTWFLSWAVLPTWPILCFAKNGDGDRIVEYKRRRVVDLV